jgi:hypothetical protein
VMRTEPTLLQPEAGGSPLETVNGSHLRITHLPATRLVDVALSVHWSCSQCVDWVDLLVFGLGHQDWKAIYPDSWIH